MTHLNRWRTLTATATTAVLAAGAFGISAADDGSAPDDIRIASEASVSEPVADIDATPERSVQSTESQVREEAVSGTTAGPDVAVTELQADATASISAADVTPSPDDSPSPSPDEDSPSPSPEDEDDDSPASITSDNIQPIAAAGDDDDGSLDSVSVDDNEDSLDSAS